VDEAGRAPIRVRISHKGTRRFVSTDLNVQASKWKPEAEQVQRSHPRATEVNAALQRVRLAVHNALVEVETSPIQVTADRLRDAIEEALRPDEKPDPEVTFLAFAQEKLKSYDRYGTRRNHQSGLNKFKQFLQEKKGRADIPLSPAHLTPALLEEMMHWERTVLNNAVNTVHKTMRTLRRMTRLAIRDGHFPKNAYPFDRVELTRKRTEKTSLHPTEVEKLERLLEQVRAGDALYPEPGTLALHTLHVFLFQMYMLGMRWGDACILSWDQVGQDRITYRMRKTGRPKDLKIVPKAQHILRDYAHRRGDRSYVFPFMDRYEDHPEYDLTNNEDLDRVIQSRNSKANEALKSIASTLDIDTHLTTHVARHSFAEAAMRSGWSLQEISTAMGHGDVSVTQAYLRTLRDDELDDKHESLF
jgi:integrase